MPPRTALSLFAATVGMPCAVKDVVLTAVHGTVDFKHAVNKLSICVRLPCHLMQMTA